MGRSLRLGCIFLASGYSKRFGGNKLLAPLNGKPLAELVFERFPSELFQQTVVVTRYPAVAVSAALQGFTVVENEDPSGDLAQTIRLGLEALRPGMDGCLFSVCDQPMLRVQSIRSLVQAFYEEPQRIVALGFDGRRGNPVLFPSALFGELASLPAQNGGGTVIAAHPALLRLVQAQDERELWDVDYPSDLAALT